MFFSVIVPVYNVELYLSAAIESVVNQGELDYELILIDDGSTDICPQICDDYAVKYPNIRVIHKKNGGLSDARNVGIKEAIGKYIFFLDSDDLLNESSLEKSKKFIIDSEFPDIMIGNMLNMEGNSVSCRLPFDVNKIEAKKINTVIEKFINEYGFIPWAAYQSIYNREYLIKNNYLFDKSIIGAEDCDFFMSIIQKNVTFSISGINLVIYRMQREGSIITNPKFSAILGQLEVFAKWYNFYDKCGCTIQKDYFAERFTNIVMLSGYLSSGELKRCTNYIEKHKNIIKHCKNSTKYLIAKCVWKILGYGRGSKLLLKVRGK